MRRHRRKHAVALLTLVVYHLVLFLPPLLEKRVLSANDIFYSIPPWNSVTPSSPANGLLADVATSWWTLAALAKSEPESLHWNPYIGSGAPGFGSWMYGFLSPFALAVLAVPLGWFYALLFLLKVNTAFVLSYFWLREERMGKTAAVFGAAVMSAAGIYVCWWWWPLSNAIPLYGGLLWMVRRAVDRKAVPFHWMLALALGFATSGYPATIAYAAYMAAALLLFHAVAHRKTPSAKFWMRAAAACVVAILLLLPFLASSFRLLNESGYLSWRKDASFVFDAYPLSHLSGFVRPYRLFDHAGFAGDVAFLRINNLLETTIFVGKLAAVLALAGLLSRRARSRWFWAAFLAVTVACAFAFTPAVTAIGSLPGISYTPLTRIRFVFPVPVAYLAAAGCALLLSQLRRRAGTQILRLLHGFVPVIAALEYAAFATVVVPFIDSGLARPRDTAALAHLKRQTGLFRVAATGNFMSPNTAQFVGLQDIRSHFSSELAYRSMLERIDPQSFGSTGTVILFNAARMNLSDSVWSFLNVRYLLDAPGGLLEERVKQARSPFIRVARFRDADLYENKRVMPRFFAIWQLVVGPDAVLLDPGLDLATTAVVHAATDVEERVGRVPAESRSARVVLRSYSAVRQELSVASAAGFVLMSSEKLTPELEVQIDSSPVSLIRANGVFAAVWIPAGSHRVTFTRRIGRGLWWTPLCALVLMTAIAIARYRFHFARKRDSFRT